MFKSFQSRMILFFSLLFILIQCGVLYAVYQAFETRLIDEAKDELSYASQVFQRRLVFQDDILKTQALLIVSDRAFQNILKDYNISQLYGRLTELQNTYKVERMLLITDGQIIIDTGKEIKASPISFILKSTLEAKIYSKNTDADVNLITFIKLDGLLYEFYMVAINDPKTHKWIWLGVGSAVIQDSLHELNQKFSANLGVLLYDKPNDKLVQPTNPNLVSAIGSVKGLSKQSLSSFLKENEVLLEQQQEVNVVVINGQKYLSVPVHLVKGAGDIHRNLGILLLYPYSEIFKMLNQLMMKLLLLFSYGLLFIVVGAWLLGIKMSEPIKELVKVARQIAKGNYDVDLPKRRQDEFKTLSETFGYMVKTIQTREAEIRHTALHDLQTQLPNRQYFEVLLDAELKRLSLNKIQNIGMMFIGIGRLNEISYTLGHRISDLLILKLIGRLSAYEGVKVLARFSDDKMILLFENQSMTELESAAFAIHILLEDPYRIQSFKIDITPYIGLCLIQNVNSDARAWIRRGDHVLYRAQLGNHNVLLYEPSMDRLSSDQLSIMGDLVSGIKNDEFELWFQPKISLTGQQIYYVEALVRWHRPNRGLVKPEDFIPLAERTGHIQKLTHWALDQTCLYIRKWLDQGYEIKVAVNISSRDLVDEGLLKLLNTKLDHYDIPSNLFALEITESDVIKNIQKAKLILEAINHRGISIAIDDFGVGYSSIAYLKELPANEIKIDKSFITKLNIEPESVMIVGSIIQLAHKMGLSVVAEGVESEEVISQLYHYHCDYVQGYYYSEPIAADQLLKWYKSNG
ncbi:MAG: EAL domain-containing protein [Gammaproteobacteria bacterium]|nr:MAG: EAL domain-containing protein [Gammaproteobacteria bacterium]UTW43648.1 EAL domain-containing protein [bacterium SCSIO 12844]